ncbi:hypothetical protein AB832_03705 [Flavobacteriaceae bacterium (ex Bugula neritina AB1)]|nr:hypothetical protein AB832_03705 [Flavobacteriaceae bacterium (ex Bugula neritina AB1)]
MYFRLIMSKTQMSLFYGQNFYKMLKYFYTLSRFKFVLFAVVVNLLLTVIYTSILGLLFDSKIYTNNADFSPIKSFVSMVFIAPIIETQIF